MRLYKTANGIVVEDDSRFYFLKNEAWDRFVNDDDLFQKMKNVVQSTASTDGMPDILLPPVQSQELWASGVTYFRSKQ